MSLQTFFDNFALLANAPNGVAKLRELILQLAARGKIVPQNPKEEPAIKLVEKIDKEKRLLYKEGKIRKPAPTLPFEAVISNGLPLGWQYVRLKDIGEFCGGGTPSKSRSDFWDGDIFWVSPKDMKADRIASSGPPASIACSLTNRMARSVISDCDLSPMRADPSTLAGNYSVNFLMTLCRRLTGVLTDRKSLCLLSRM